MIRRPLSIIDFTAEEEESMRKFMQDHVNKTEGKKIDKGKGMTGNIVDAETASGKEMASDIALKTKKILVKESDEEMEIE